MDFRVCSLPRERVLPNRSLPMIMFVTILKHGLWIMKLFGCGRMFLWPTLSSNPEFTWEDWRKLRNISSRFRLLPGVLTVYLLNASKSYSVWTPPAFLSARVKAKASRLVSCIQLRPFIMKTWNFRTEPLSFPYMSDSTNPSNIIFSVMDSGY
jgi:hypothetical protein